MRSGVVMRSNPFQSAVVLRTLKYGRPVLFSTSEKNPAVVAAILGALSQPRAGVARMARELHISPSSLIGELAELRESGLVEFSFVRRGKPGRPMRSIEATALGKEYLLACERLERMVPRSRRSDLRRASSDAAYAERLAAIGVSPYALFFELEALGRRT